MTLSGRKQKLPRSVSNQGFILYLRYVPKSFLVIQTAFIGDVVLATALVEKLHQHYPHARIDFLLRKGNEGLLKGHPFIHEVLIWNKKQQKLRNLFRLLQLIRRKRYDGVINVQRFAATGLLTVFSGARLRIGFDKNPWSRFFDRRVPHVVSTPSYPIHEVERNQSLIAVLTDAVPARPKLYPSQADTTTISALIPAGPFICIAPASVWFTKQYPARKWASFIRQIPSHYQIFLLGGPEDRALCAGIIEASEAADRVVDLSGRLSFLESAALQSRALMSYVNDSAPLHFASATNAPVTAVYCSTLPSFGFGPLSDQRFIVEIAGDLACRPCGLHGRKACPEKHFNCAMNITDQQLLDTLPR